RPRHAFSATPTALPSAGPSSNDRRSWGGSAYVPQLHAQPCTGRCDKNCRSLRSGRRKLSPYPGRYSPSFSEYSSPFKLVATKCETRPSPSVSPMASITYHGSFGTGHTTPSTAKRSAGIVCPGSPARTTYPYWTPPVTVGPSSSQRPLSGGAEPPTG